MSETIRYCANGCTRINRDGHPIPTYAHTGNLCRRCHENLDEWLSEIPDRYARVPDYLLPGADLDRNPESKATKRTDAPAPVRLAALDLLDERIARTMNGLAPVDHIRGTLGHLHAIANEIRDQRGSHRAEHKPHVMGEADLIRDHLDWVSGLGHIAEIYDEVKALHRDLGYAIGAYPPRPVGRCKQADDEAEPDEAGEQPRCGGPLLPVHGGVRCLQCRAVWGHDRLRELGRDIGETA